MIETDTGSLNNVQYVAVSDYSSTRFYLSDCSFHCMFSVPVPAEFNFHS
jgi:hypothetical protein